MPTHMDRHIPYAEEGEPYPPRMHPRTSLPILWIAAAAMLALLLFIVLRS